MVANKNKLMGKMAENEVSVPKLSKELGLNYGTVRNKINSNKYEFTLSESIKIKTILGLTDAEYLEIFIYF